LGTKGGAVIELVSVACSPGSEELPATAPAVAAEPFAARRTLEEIP